MVITSPFYLAAGGYAVDFTVTNGDATDAAAGLTFDLTVSANATLVSATPTAGAFVDPTWTLGALAAGATETLVVIFSIDDLTQGSFDITLTKTAGTPYDPNSANNTVTHTLSTDALLEFNSVKTITNADTPYDLLLGADKFLIIDGTAGDVTVNLGDPDAWLDNISSQSIETHFYVLNDNSGASTITLATDVSGSVVSNGVTAGDLVLVEGESARLVTDGTNFYDYTANNADVGGAVMEVDFDANTILAADTDDTPAAVTVAEQTLVGRITAGNITALTATEVRTLLNVEDGADVTDETNVLAAVATADIVSNTMQTITEEDLAASAAASLTVETSYFTTAGAETATLAAGTTGLVKNFACIGYVGDMVITVTNPGWGGAGTITFSAVGDACQLKYNGAKWNCIGNNGCVLA